MKIVLTRGGNYKGARFEASEQPQDVPDPFGRALIARGLATQVKATKKPPMAVRPATVPEGDDD